MDFFSSIFNKITEFIANAMNAVLGWLSGIDPLSGLDNVVRDFLSTSGQGVGWANWFLDLGFGVKLLAALLAVLGIWQVISLVLRWIKFIDD